MELTAVKVCRGLDLTGTAWELGCALDYLKLTACGIIGPYIMGLYSLVSNCLRLFQSNPDCKFWFKALEAIRYGIVSLKYIYY